jgi:uncharacterized protein DUF3892
MRYQITNVNKNKNENIIKVGCHLDDLVFTEQDVINKINSGDTFYTCDPISQQMAEIEVIQCKDKQYIKSANDCTTANNLYNLPPC